MIRIWIPKGKGQRPLPQVGEGKSVVVFCSRCNIVSHVLGVEPSYLVFLCSRFNTVSYFIDAERSTFPYLILYYISGMTTVFL